MVRIAPVRLAYNPKTLWFDPGELEVKKEDAVVVSTARGVEFGYMDGEVFEADEASVEKLRSELKPILRRATKSDREQARKMEQLSAEALPLFKEMAREASKNMHPVSVEYLLEGDKAIFYFEADERVDFRELVRNLATCFHVRIDMRQIGVRDEARMVGGLGHCGQELCCKRMGGEFCPVSIRMAKEQDLSLNPQKISGVCGRLMCCLRYEYEAYKDFKGRAPKLNAHVDTPLGSAKVVDLDVPREVVCIKPDGEKVVKVPLSGFDTPEDNQRPCCVCEQAWQKASETAQISIHPESDLATSSLFSANKPIKEANTQKAKSVGKHTNPKAAKGEKRRKNSGAPMADPHKARKRRSTKMVAGSAAQAGASAPTKSKAKPSENQSQQKRQNRKPKMANAAPKKSAARTKAKQSDRVSTPPKKSEFRPGRRSSGLRAGESAGPQAEAKTGHRRARRRSHRSDNSSARDDSQKGSKNSTL